MLKKLFAALLALLAAAAFAAVDVNKATQADLESIKGIGPVIATKILDERKKGSFKNWDDMVIRVKGIGEGNAARFSADGLTVNGSAFAGAPAAAKQDTKTATPRPAAVPTPVEAAPAKGAKSNATTPAAKAPEAVPAMAMKPAASAPESAADKRKAKADERAGKKAAAADEKAAKKAAKAEAKEAKETKAAAPSKADARTPPAAAKPAASAPAPKK